MKRRYKKPEVKRVKLVPEEAVLSACKLTMDAKNANRCAENNCRNKLMGS